MWVGRTRTFQGISQTHEAVLSRGGQGGAALSNQLRRAWKTVIFRFESENNNNKIWETLCTPECFTRNFVVSKPVRGLSFVSDDLTELVPRYPAYRTTCLLHTWWWLRVEEEFQYTYYTTTLKTKWIIYCSRAIYPTRLWDQSHFVLLKRVSF